MVSFSVAILVAEGVEVIIGKIKFVYVVKDIAYIIGARSVDWSLTLEA